MNDLSQLRRVRLRQACLHAVTESQCVSLVMRDLAAGQGGWIVTMNLDHLRRFVQDQRYAALCRESTLLVADGMPLIWASRLQGTPLPERVTGSDLIWSLSAAAAAQRQSIFLLGGAPGTAQATAQALRQRFPTLSIAGIQAPYFGTHQQQPEIDRFMAHVVQPRPNIIFVAFGSPKAEALISTYRHLLPGAWWIGVGISFSFVSGQIRRPPRWAQGMGLEWFFRLMQEPRRLGKRYLVYGIPFAFSLFCSAVVHRFTR
ncbi:MAG: glycosyltransferase [Chloroflexi bacterium]|nr:glycosyltransferase [Chloroflexota bacterium]